MSTKLTNPKDVIGITKLPLHLFPTTAIAYGCLALFDGGSKYGYNNFRAMGVRATVYIDACRRHLDAWLEGQEVDPNSDLHPLAHALASIAILIEAIEQGNLTDDRNYGGDAYLAMVERLTPMVSHIAGKYKNKPVPKHFYVADN